MGVSMPVRGGLLQSGAPPARSHRRIVLRSAPTAAAIAEMDTPATRSRAASSYRLQPTTIGILAAPLGGRHLGGDRREGATVSVGWLGMGLVKLLGSALDGAVIAVDDGANGVAEVAQQMPAVGTPGSRPAHPDGSRLHTRPHGRGRRSRSRGADVATQRVSRPAGLAGVPRPHCVQDRRGWFRSGVLAATPSRRPQEPLGLAAVSSATTGLAAIRNSVSGLIGMAKPFGQSRGCLAAEREGDVTLEIAEPGRSTRRH